VAETLASLPVWWANVITLIGFVLIAAACFRVPRDAVIADAPDQSRWRDLRWWALALIGVQLTIYGIFS
jgi:hypothetical protein